MRGVLVTVVSCQSRFNIGAVAKHQAQSVSEAHGRHVLQMDTDH